VSRWLGALNVQRKTKRRKAKKKKRGFFREKKEGNPLALIGMKRRQGIRTKGKGIVIEIKHAEEESCRRGQKKKKEKKKRRKREREKKR
jgi:hypothetical protein